MLFSIHKKELFSIWFIPMNLNGILGDKHLMWHFCLWTCCWSLIGSQIIFCLHCTGEECSSQVQFGHISSSSSISISSAFTIFPPFYHSQVFINSLLLNALIVSDKVVHMSLHVLSFLTQRVGPLENLVQILFLHFRQRSYVVASLHRHTCWSWSDRGVTEAEKTLPKKSEEISLSHFVFCGYLVAGDLV